MSKINRYAKAMRQMRTPLKESVPTNSMQGIYVATPFVITPQAEILIQGASADYDQDDSANDTSGLFDAEGNQLTGVPPVTTASPDNSYILGPMASMWYSWGNFSTFGYIRESDRRMVNLGKITGPLHTWDKTSNFTSYGQLTLEQAVWFTENKKYGDVDNNYANANYRAFYPGPPSSSTDEHGRYWCTITGVPKDPDIPYKPDDKFTPGTNMSSDDPDSPLNDIIPGSANPEYADRYGISRDRWEEMTDQERSDFINKMESLQADIDKFSQQQQEAEKEARDILIRFGIDVALTLFGGVILKGVGAAVSAGIKGVRVGTKANAIRQAANVIKNVDKVDDAAAVATATQAYNAGTKGNSAIQAVTSAADKIDDIKNIASHGSKIDDVVGAATKPALHGTVKNTLTSKTDDAAQALYSSILKSNDPKTKAAANALQQAIDSGSEKAVKQAMQNVHVNVLGHVKGSGTSSLTGAVKSAQSTATSIVDKAAIKIKPAFQKASASFDLGGSWTDISVNQFKSILTNPQKFGIKPGSKTWTRVQKYAKDYLVQSYEPHGQVLLESTKKILREIKQPYVMPEEKKVKITGYKPKIPNQDKMRQIADSMNVPEKVTYAKAETGTWLAGELERGRKSSQSKKNEVLELLGQGEDSWEYMTETSRKKTGKAMYENFTLMNEQGVGTYKINRKEPLRSDFVLFLEYEDGTKSTMLQSELNEKMADDSEKWRKDWKEPIKYEDQPAYKKVKKILSKEIPLKDIQPEFPKKAPPKLDPETQMHPDMFKRHDYFTKLDPDSAKTMAAAPTGDPQIDSEVEKAKKKPK